MPLVKPQDFGEDSREEGGGAAAVPSEGTSFWRRFGGGKGGAAAVPSEATIFWRRFVVGKGGAAAVSSEATEVQFGRQTFVFPKGLFNRRS